MRKTSFVVAATAFIWMGMPAAGAAPSTSAMGNSLTDSSISITQQVQFRRHCRRWNRECRARWGWGWRYRRCMVRHGC